MKKFLSLMLVGCGLLGVTGAEARSLMPPVFHAMILRVNLDRRLPESHLTGTGSITLDFARSRARLVLNLGPACPPGGLCSHIAYPSKVLELPIVGRETDGCGNQVYTAVMDRRPVDGGLTRLLIRDHRADHCKYMVAVAPTEVQMETIFQSRAGGVVKRFSTFEADRLMPEFADVIR